MELLGPRSSEAAGLPCFFQVQDYRSHVCKSHAPRSFNCIFKDKYNPVIRLLPSY